MARWYTTAGGGVTHSEEATGRYRGQLHGVQLWVAQPEATRHGPAAFEHHAELPQVELDTAAATVLVGSFAGAASPARRDTELVGVDAAMGPGTGAWPLRPSFEHALVVLEGEVLAAELTLSPTHTAAWGRLQEDSGLALRFPRFTGRWRDDKTPTDATTVDEVVAMYRPVRA